MKPPGVPTTDPDQPVPCPVLCRSSQKVIVFELREPVSAASHLLTAVWAVFATVIMIRLAGRGRRLAFLLYGLSMVTLFTASGLFHGVHFDSPEERRFYERLDYSAIFLLIAGTNTPALTVLLRGQWRRWCLTLVWGLALTGYATIWIFPKPRMELAASMFLALGWLGMAPVLHYYRALGWRAMNWVWLGAAFYTGGIVCELAEWPVIVPGWFQWHEVFHFCDTAANLAFFVFGVRYVLPYRAADPSAPVPPTPPATDPASRTPRPGPSAPLLPPGLAKFG